MGGLVLGAVGLIESFALDAHAAALSYTDDGANYVVNTGANLVFKVNHSNGDLVSLVYRRVDYQGYNGKNSQVETGLGASAVTIKATSAAIVIKVVHGTLVHYYVARAGENNIYLFSYKDAASTTMQRFIVRLKPGLLKFTGGDSWSASVSTIESGDIFKEPDGTTHAKHYSGVRVKDYDYVGAKTVGVFRPATSPSATTASGTPPFTYAIPASAFQTDVTQWNLLKLNIISGSAGDGHLSPGVSYDCANRDHRYSPDRRRPSQ